MQRQIEQTVEQRQQIMGGEVDRWIEAGKMQTSIRKLAKST
jgi:hypothetical protein